MKKFILLLFLFTGTFSLYACSKNGTYQLAKNHISEARISFYEGQTDDVYVSYMCGYREKDYKLDGSSTPLIEFGVITFFVGHEIDKPSFVLNVGDHEYSGTLEQNPFDQSYVADIKVIDINEQCTVKLLYDDTQINITLNNSIGNFKMDYQQALEMACKAVDLKELTESGEFKGECYIKIVKDKTISDNCFYYVNILGQNDKTYSVIIDPINKDVLLKKVKDKSYILGY